MGIHEGVRSEAVLYSHAVDSCVAGRQHINVRVADDHRLAGLHTGLLQQRLHSDGIGLLSVEAVAAIDLKEVAAQAKGFHNRAGWHNRLIAQHCHLDRLSVAAWVQEIERFLDSSVNISVIELVFAIVEQKELQRALDVDSSSGSP